MRSKFHEQVWRALRAAILASVRTDYATDGVAA
jgi:hypothetical protein